MKPIIGIVSRNEQIKETTYQAITKNNLKNSHNKCSYLGIISYNNNKIDKNILSLCDGIIIPGGNQIYPYHYELVEYAIQNKIPVLGICMGCQLLGLYNNGQDDKYLNKVKNHCGKSKKHKVFFEENTIMHQLFGSSIITNTRHKYQLKKVSYPFKITGRTKDNVIESIEYIDNNNILIGVQWHPEDLDNMQELYNYFLEEVVKRKNK